MGVNMLSSFLKTVNGKFIHVGNTELTSIYALCTPDLVIWGSPQSKMENMDGESQEIRFTESILTSRRFF